MTEQSVGTTGGVTELPDRDSAVSLFARTSAGTGVAALLVLVVRAVAVAVDPGLASLAPFGVEEILGSTLFAGAGAALAYAAVVRYSADPVRTFLGVAVVAFVVSLLPVALAAPDLGVGFTGQLWLVALHVAVAVPLTVAVARLVER